MHAHRHDLCRVCRRPLSSILNLGTMHLSGFPRDEEALARAPLDLCRCSSCKLVQLRHTVSPDEMFRRYWYQSGVNEAMLAELGDVVKNAIEHAGGLAHGDTVIDIGANDGSLLSKYPNPDLSHLTRIAFEPAVNLQPSLSPHCDVLLSEYFPGTQRGSVLLCRSLEGRVKIVTSIACFYAVDDPVSFVSAIDGLLSSDGVWVVQFQDLHQMVQATAFDDICHEHLFYPSLASVERLLEPFDLVVFDAQQRKINGGSLRLSIGRHHRTVLPSVGALCETEAGCEEEETLRDFAQRVSDARTRIRETVLSSVASGKIVDLYGASTKGNTLLQFCGLGPDLIRQAWERSEEKWERQTVTGIPIVSEQAGRSDPPDVLLVLIWQFRDAILRREADYLAHGGQFLFPLPVVELVPGRGAA